MVKVLIFGTFDGLHPGHINFFEQARKLGDYLIAVVGRDATVKAIKGRLPRQNEVERLAAVGNSNLIDEAVLGGLGNPYEIIKKIKPDIIALGYDQTSFTANLESELKRTNITAEIARLKPYESAIYKSSLINKKTE